MKCKVFTKDKILHMSTAEFQMFNTLLNSKAFRLLGIMWTKWIKVEQDQTTGDVVITYE